MLEYKAEWYGRQLITIDRYYPTHQSSLPLRGEDRAEGHARPHGQGMDVPGLRNNP